MQKLVLALLQLACCSVASSAGRLSGSSGRSLSSSLHNSREPPLDGREALGEGGAGFGSGRKLRTWSGQTCGSCHSNCSMCSCDVTCRCTCSRCYSGFVLNGNQCLEVVSYVGASQQTQGQGDGGVIVRSHEDGSTARTFGSWLLPSNILGAAFGWFG